MAAVNSRGKRPSRSAECGASARASPSRATSTCILLAEPSHDDC